MSWFLRWMAGGDTDCTKLHDDGLVVAGCRAVVGKTPLASGRTSLPGESLRSRTTLSRLPSVVVSSASSKYVFLTQEETSSCLSSLSVSRYVK